MCEKMLGVFTILALFVAGLFIGVSLCHAADLPLVIMQPNGQIAYVYPGQHGLPTVIMPATGAPLTYVWPGSSVAPLVLPAPAPVTVPVLPGWPQ